MTDIVLAADQLVSTEEEKTWVVETLLKRQIALAKQEPVDAITHDVRLGLIGENNTFLEVSRFDEMTHLFSDMKVANIHISHVCVARPDCLVSDETAPDAGHHAFMLSDALAWFARELEEHDGQTKVAQCQSLGMLLVFMVRKSFMSDFEGGVELAHHFLNIIKHFPGLDARKGVVPLGAGIEDLSSVDVSCAIFRYLSGQGQLPSHEIAIVLLQGDFVINGIEGAIDFFEDETAHDNVRVSCHFIPYLPELSPPKGIIRLGDLIAMVAAGWPAPGERATVVLDNMMGLLYHVINSNAKSTPRLSGEAVQQMVRDYQRIMREMMQHRH